MMRPTCASSKLAGLLNSTNTPTKLSRWHFLGGVVTYLDSFWCFSTVPFPQYNRTRAQYRKNTPLWLHPQEKSSLSTKKKLQRKIISTKNWKKKRAISIARCVCSHERLTNVTQQQQQQTIRDCTMVDKTPMGILLKRKIGWYCVYREEDNNCYYWRKKHHLRLNDFRKIRFQKLLSNVLVVK